MARNRKVTDAEVSRATNIFKEFNLKPTAVEISPGKVRLEAASNTLAISSDDDLDTELARFREQNGSR